MKKVYVDDHRAHIEGEPGRPGPDGPSRVFSLAALLIDEAESHEEFGDPYNILLAKMLRRAADFARRTGAMEPEDFRLEEFFGADSASAVPVAE